MDQGASPLMTGKEMEYLHVCKRKLWFFRHGIRPELGNELVQLGILLGQTTFRRQDKELQLGGVGVVDWAELQHGTIHETKSSSCPMQADVAQVRYYLWWMRERGINVDRCVIHYPKQKRTKEVVWAGDMTEEVTRDLAEAGDIVSRPHPPPRQRLRWCRRCAYADLCLV